MEFLNFLQLRTRTLVKFSEQWFVVVSQTTARGTLLVSINLPRRSLQPGSRSRSTGYNGHAALALERENQAAQKSAPQQGENAKTRQPRRPRPPQERPRPPPQEGPRPSQEGPRPSQQGHVYHPGHKKGHVHHNKGRGLRASELQQPRELHSRRTIRLLQQPRELHHNKRHGELHSRRTIRLQQGGVLQGATRSSQSSYGRGSASCSSRGPRRMWLIRMWQRTTSSRSRSSSSIIMMRRLYVISVIS